MVRWGSAPSFEQREWDQCPKFSLCQPIASRERALDIWPCHPVDCRWCISQLGSTLSSMKLWEWLVGRKKGRQRERRNEGGCLIRLLKHSWRPSICTVAVVPKLDSSLVYSVRVQLWGNCLFTWVTEVFSQQCSFLNHGSSRTFEKTLMFKPRPLKIQHSQQQVSCKK